MELFSVVLLPTEVHARICTVLTVIEIRLYPRLGTVCMRSTIILITN